MKFVNSGASYAEEMEAILASDLPEMEKLAAAYGGLTGFIIEIAEGEIELARALDDREGMVKQQVKMETLKFARDIFQQCYRGVTGKKAWDEQTKR
jgi:hypothetical protein